MRTHTTIITALAALVALCLPASALAGSPLLSGYGGPGSGEQQLVGAGLVGGGSGGGGSAGSGTGGGSGASAGAPSAGGLTSTGHGAALAGIGKGGGVSVSGAHGAQRSGEAREGRRTSRPTRGKPSISTEQDNAASAHLAAASAPVVAGLGDGEMLVIGLAAVALVGLALVTRRLAGLQREQRSADRGHMNVGGSH